MFKRNFILLCLLLIELNGFSQTDPTPFRIWQLTRFSGQANIRGNYREYESTIGDITDKHTEAYLNGILQVRSQSYFVHPNFMLLDVNGTYNPETTRNSYVGVPDYSEKSTSQGVDASAIFFKKKNFNLSTNASIYTGIQNLDNLTRIKATTKYMGATFSYVNKILPFNVSYSDQKTDQMTVGTGRSFNMDQKVYQGNAYKSFTTYDHQSFSYLHTENKNLQSDIDLLPISTFNKMDLYNLNNDFTFGSNKNYTFSSALAKSDQQGSVLFRSLSANENLTIRLPKNFLLANNYNYRVTDQESTRVNYQRFQSTLNHQLYESLTSRLLFEHIQTDQDAYNEKRNRGGIDLKYVKKIPKGKFMLSYSYYKEYQTIKTPPTILKIVHEEYTLIDNQIILLKNQYVNIESIVVKDVTGTIIYQAGLDYILIDRNPYVEIVRVPGGLIANNASVYLDYEVSKPGMYEYNMNSHALITEVWLFKNVLNVYHHFYAQDFVDKSQSEYQRLNIFTRNVVGAKLDFGYIKGGAEYEYCNSNLLPYQGMKYFLNYQRMYNKFYFLLSANLSDYQIANENARRQDIDLSSKVAYSVFSNVKINWDYTFRTMKGRGIDLTIHSSKFEITATLHKLYLSAGTELYWNQDLNSKANYRGTFIQLTRYF